MCARLTSLPRRPPDPRAASPSTDSTRIVSGMPRHEDLSAADSGADSVARVASTGRVRDLSLRHRCGIVDRNIIKEPPEYSPRRLSVRGRRMKSRGSAKPRVWTRFVAQARWPSDSPMNSQAIIQNDARADRVRSVKVTGVHEATNSLQAPSEWQCAFTLRGSGKSGTCAVRGSGGVRTHLPACERNA